MANAVHGDGYVSVLLGLGDGSFAAAVQHDSDNVPSSLAAGDLNGDLVPDLAVANSGSYPYTNSESRCCWPWATGRLAGTVNCAAGYGPHSAAIGDLDGDQAPDLAVANTGGANVLVLMGLGDGTFSVARNYDAAEPSSATIGDGNGDQMPDLAVANAGSDNVSVFLNQLRPCLGDLNCDGRIDFGDINPFVLMLSNWPEWLARYPDCPPRNADINGDGVYGGQYGFGDINAMVDLLASGQGQPIPCP